MVSSEADVLNKNVNKGSLEGAIKTIFGTKADLVFLYMILYSIQTFSGKLAMATGHAMLINLHHLNNANNKFA